MGSGVMKRLTGRGISLSDKTNEIINIIIGIAILLGGLIFLHLTNTSDKDYQRLISNGDIAVATITDIEESSIRSKNGAYPTFYELKTYVYSVNGTEYSFKDKKEKPKNSPKKGSTVTVFYDKDNPAKAVIKRPGTQAPSKFLQYSIIGLGSIITINGIRQVRYS